MAQKALSAGAPPGRTFKVFGGVHLIARRCSTIAAPLITGCAENRHWGRQFLQRGSHAFMYWGFFAGPPPRAQPLGDRRGRAPGSVRAPNTGCVAPWRKTRAETSS